MKNVKKNCYDFPLTPYLLNIFRYGKWKGGKTTGSSHRGVGREGGRREVLLGAAHQEDGDRPHLELAQLPWQLRSHIRSDELPAEADEAWKNAPFEEVYNPATSALTRQVKTRLRVIQGG